MMKRILILLLALVMCMGVFASCGNKDNNDAGNEGTNAAEGTGTTAGTSGSTDDEPATLADALAVLKNLFKDKNEVTERDYDVVAQVKVGATVFAVTWTVDKSEITIKESEKEGFWTVDLPDSVEAELAYVLTATITDADGKTETYTVNRKIPVVDNTGIVNAPKADEAYKLFMKQANLGQRLYMTTEPDQEKYLKGSADPKDAAVFYAEVVEGGFKFYTTVGETKMYLNATAEKYTNEDGQTKFSKVLNLAAESTNVWYYKAEVNAWMTMIGDQEFVVGSYNNFSTFCISESCYINAENSGVSQFTMNIYTQAHADTQTPDPEPGAATEKTIKEFLAIAEALADKAATPEKYIVEGKITEIKSTEYGNMYIEDNEGNKLYIYGCYDIDGKNRYDAMNPQPQVGDTIVVMGVAKNYSGPQMEKAWVQSINGEAYKPAGSENKPSEGGDPVTPDTTTSKVIYFGADKKYVTAEEYVYEGKTTKTELVLSENKADAVAFTIVNNDNGSISFKAGDKYLFADGTDVKFVTETGEFTEFVLENTDGGVFIKCMTATFNDKPQYLEVYSGYLTCYGMGSNTAIYTFELQDA